MDTIDEDLELAGDAFPHMFRQTASRFTGRQAKLQRSGQPSLPIASFSMAAVLDCRRESGGRLKGGMKP
jgi:hypothetical protein